MCKPVHIPMAGGMESLNVAMAGAVMMFALSGGVQQLLWNIRHGNGSSGGHVGGGPGHGQEGAGDADVRVAGSEG